MGKKRLKRIERHLSSIDVTLAKQSVILDEHVKRSNMLEAKLEPVEKHVAMVQGGFKLFGVLALILGVFKAMLGMWMHG